MNRSRRVRPAAIVLVAALSAAVSASVFVRADDPSTAVTSLLAKLKSAARAQDEMATLDIMRRLNGLATEDAYVGILDAIVMVPSSLVLDQGVGLFKERGSAALDPVFLSTIASKKGPWMRTAVIMTVAIQLDDAASENWIVQGLQHPDENVQRVSIDGAQKRRSKAAIPHLIAILERDGVDKSATSYDAHMALISLTGRDFEVIEDWRNFWEGSKEGLDPKNLDKGRDGTTGVELKRPVASAATFFGVEIAGANVIFVIDISGSMEKWDAGGAEEGGKGASWQVRQRITRAKRQLKDAISKLNSNARFNIIAYNETVTAFQKKLVPWGKSSAGAASVFIEKLTPFSATHTDEALAKAFEDPSIDTLILLTDGAPMKTNRERAPVLIPRILDQVKKANRLRRVRIFTFGFDGLGEWPPGSKYIGQEEDPPAMLIDFLKKLAEQNGGIYTSIQ